MIGRQAIGAPARYDLVDDLLAGQQARQAGMDWASRRVNHRERYADGPNSTNHAESFFSKVRRSELGVHPHISVSIRRGPFWSRERSVIGCRSAVTVQRWPRGR